MGTHSLKSDSKIILDAIRTLVRALRVSSRACESASGRTSAQIFILEQLAAHGSLSVNELADHTFTHQSTVSGVVARLIEEGLVLRAASKSDARRIELSLTAKGTRAHHKAPRTAQQEIARAIGTLTPAKRKQFGKLFQELITEAGFTVAMPPLFFEESTPGVRRG